MRAFSFLNLISLATYEKPVQQAREDDPIANVVRCVDLHSLQISKYYLNLNPISIILTR